MNNARRNEIKDTQKKLVAISKSTYKLIEDFRDRITELNSEAESIESEISDFRDQEQEYFDNMPESLQNGERGIKAEEAVNALDSAQEIAHELTYKLEALNDALKEVEAEVQTIDDAVLSLEEAMA